MTAKIGTPSNVVYVIDGLGLGGAERLMIPLLANLERQYFTPRVCVLQNKHGNPIANDLKALGVPVDFLPVRHLRDLTAVPRMVRYLNEFHADLIHTQLEFSNVLGNVAAKWLKKPSICTVHTIPSQDMDAKARFHQNTEFFCLRNFCDMVVSVSDEAKRFHMDVAGVSDQKICTIYNGIDLANISAAALHADPVAVRREFGIPQPATLLITVAVLRELKGIQFMIRAMPAILKECPDAYYLIVGSGEHHDKLVEEAKQQGVEERVIFAGARKDIPAVLSAADLFVLPTLTEALPTVLAEAMSAKLPIVVSRVGGVPEMVTDGLNGRLVEAGNVEMLVNSCVELIRSPQVRSEMGANGRAVVEEKFDVRAQIGHLRDLYLKLMSDYEKR